MPDTILRQIVMLKMLPREPWSITTAQLKSKLLDEEGYKVTLRTVQRDLQKLSLVFPITCREDTGQNQTLGWYWPKIAKAEVFPSMGPMVALTYKLAQRFLQDLLPPSTLEHLDPYFGRADEVLKNAHTSRLRHWAHYVHIIPRTQALIPAPVKPGVADPIYQALMEGRQIEASYRARTHQREKFYVVNPLGLVFRGSASYLVGRIEGDPMIKQFALHRFVEAEMTKTQSRAPAGFSMHKYLEDHAFDYPRNAGTILLKARFSKYAINNLLESPLSRDQKVIGENDNTSILTATVRDTQQLRSWLMGFGDHAEILEPEALRQHFRTMSRNLHTIYSGGEFEWSFPALTGIAQQLHGSVLG